MIWSSGHAIWCMEMSVSHANLQIVQGSIAQEFLFAIRHKDPRSAQYTLIDIEGWSGQGTQDVIMPYPNDSESWLSEVRFGLCNLRIRREGLGPHINCPSLLSPSMKGLKLRSSF